MHLLQSWRLSQAQKEAPQEHWPHSLEFAEVSEDMQLHFEDLHVVHVAGGEPVMQLQAANYLLHRLEDLRDSPMVA